MSQAGQPFDASERMLGVTIILVALAAVCVAAETIPMSEERIARIGLCVFGLIWGALIALPIGFWFGARRK